MTDVGAKVADGKISIRLETVLAKRMVRFEYANNGVSIPLLSYIAQSGRVVTAISMCEPCQSTRFHIQGKVLVCDACYTEWNLESLKGIRGECMNYPPELIPSLLEQGQIVITDKSA